LMSTFKTFVVMTIVQQNYAVDDTNHQA